MNKKSFFLPLLTAAFLWIPSQSFSADNQGPHRMWNELGLSADQQTKLSTIHNEMKEVRKSQQAEESSVRIKIKDELVKDSPSKTVLSGFVGELEKLHGKQMQSHIDHMIQLKTILTPEQFQKVIDKQWNGRGNGMGRQGCEGQKNCKKDCSSKGAMEGCQKKGSAQKGCEKAPTAGCHHSSPQM